MNIRILTVQRCQNPKQYDSIYIDRFSYLKEELEAKYQLKIPQVIICYKLLEGAKILEHTKQMIGADVK